MAEQYIRRGPDSGYHPQVIVPTPAKNAGSPVGAPEPPAPRIAIVGASLLDQITPERFTPYERKVRVAGAASMYDPAVSPSRPVQFTAMNFALPNTMGLIVNKIMLRAFTWSGIAASDTVEVDTGNLTTSIGYVFTYGGETKPYNSLSTVKPLVFANGSGQLTTPENFQDAMREANKASPSGLGNGLFLFDEERPGTDQGPVSVYIDPQSKTFQINVYIFNQLPIPVAFFQAEIGGYLTDQQTAEKLRGSIRP